MGGIGPPPRAVFPGCRDRSDPRQRVAVYVALGTRPSSMSSAMDAYGSYMHVSKIVEDATRGPRRYNDVRWFKYLNVPTVFEPPPANHLATLGEEDRALLKRVSLLPYMIVCWLRYTWLARPGADDPAEGGIAHLGFVGALWTVSGASC